MSHRLWSFVSLIGLGVALLLPGAAGAQECAGGCGSQLRACARNARGGAFACKLDCLANPPAAGRRACVQACGDTSRAARGSCRAQVGACLGTCAPAAIPSDQQTCLAGCGSALATCARAVLDDGRTCLTPCRDAADRIACWRDCVAGAQSGASACATDLNVCAAGCGVTLPPIPTPPPVDDCRGQCGAGLTQCLADVGSTAFTCASGCLGSDDLFQCLLACKAPAEQGAADCRTTFDGCTAGCAP